MGLFVRPPGCGYKELKRVLGLDSEICISLFSATYLYKTMCEDLIPRGAKKRLLLFIGSCSEEGVDFSESFVSFTVKEVQLLYSLLITCSSL